MGSKNLQQFLDDETELVQFTQRHKICSQVASALEFCHFHRILHLDVKPSNILMTDGGDCKLGDFGCSRRLPGDSDHLAVTPKLQQVGTLIYKAPELLRGQPATTKADVYSFAFVAWQCCSRKSPFDGIFPDSLYLFLLVKWVPTGFVSFRRKSTHSGFLCSFKESKAACGSNNSFEVPVASV